MRIRRRVAVAGEVLERRKDAAGLQALHGRLDVPRDVGRILAEAPDVDDGIVGIHVDVGDGREDLRDADRAGLAGRRERALLGESRVTRRGDRHRPRAVRHVFETHPEAGLEIGRDEKRNPRELLELSDEDGGSVHVRA